MSVEFEDYSVKVKNVLEEKALAFLEEAGGEIEAETKRNTRVDTGQTRGSWQHVVDDGELSCTIGSDYENAIWEEFGTGIHALNGDGRKTRWKYKDAKGNWYTTSGKKGTRAFFNAFHKLRSKIIRLAEEKFGDD